MRRYVKLASEEITKIDFTQQWPVTPFMSALLNETSIDDVVFSADGKTGMISYDTLDLAAPHTYSYVTDTGVQQYTVQPGIHGRPVFYDAATMQEITETEVSDMIEAYPAWVVDTSYTTDTKLKYDGKLYMVVMPHTSQADWTPNLVPALYREIYPETLIAPWKQPTGAHDAYQIGDKVTHNGKTWECTVANNVWEPGVYGWIEI
jgi:hypothetical protein